MKVEFTKVRPVKSPSRGTPKSSGIDLFVPEINDEFIKLFWERNDTDDGLVEIFRNKCIFLKPHSKCFIPSGIKVSIPAGFALEARNKGGVSWKQNILKIAEVIDEDYTDEIFITVYNYSSMFSVKLAEGQKIMQLVRVPAYYDDWEEVSSDQFSQYETNRGSMGSTGIH